MPDFADQLIAELDASDCWPLPRERRARHCVLAGRAFRKSDRDRLAQMQGWDVERPYYVDPLPRRIAAGFADFLFAEDATIRPDAASDADQALLDEILEENKAQARFYRAERIVVSEGEAWWKLHTNLAVAQVPLLTWNSRRDVVPLLYGDRVLAAAFVTEIARESYTEAGQDSDDPLVIVWRWLEIHTDKRVVNVLYRGAEDKLGTRVELGARTETAAYNPEWVHGLAMLAGRVVNDLDEDSDEVGLSEYDGVRDLLFALNEAVTIAAENARLTGQDRIFAAGDLIQPNGVFDASLQVYRVDADGGTLGQGDGRPPIVAVEKRYDAEPLWLHISKLVRTILTRTGLVPEFIGEDNGGQGTVTAPAIRLRLVPTSNAAKGKAREWKATLPHILHLMLQVAAKPTEQGGMNRSVTSLTEPPSVELGDPLPRDESEVTTDVAAAVTAEVMSRRTAIGELHPDWSDEQVDKELAAIREDIGSMPEPVAPPDDPHPPAPAPPEPVPTGA